MARLGRGRRGQRDTGEVVVALLSGFIDFATGVPFGYFLTSLARFLSRKARAAGELKGAVDRALEAFQEEARREGWSGEADCLIQKLQEDPKGFGKAIRESLEQGESSDFRQTLQKELKDLLDSCGLKAEHWRCFLQKILDELWQTQSFGEAVEHIRLEFRLESRIDEWMRNLESWVSEEVRRQVRRFQEEEAWRHLEPVEHNLDELGELTEATLLPALRAPYRLIPFTGKASRALVDTLVQEIGELAPRQGRVWILHGPGGVGKTRTAVEVGLELQKEGWKAYFVPSEIGEEAPFLYWALPLQPTLLILDYAEHRSQRFLEALLSAVEQQGGERKHPLALLFLMRPHPQEPVAGAVLPALSGTLGIRWTIRAVPPLREPEERLALFQKACETFREHGFGSDGKEALSYPPEHLPRTPLAVVALAFLAVQGHRVPKSEDEHQVLEALWERWEKGRRWNKALQRYGGDLLRVPEIRREALQRIEQAQIAATFGRPFTDVEEVRVWWEAHFPARYVGPAGKRLDLGWLAQRLRGLFPSTDGEGWRLPGVVPDPLADVVMIRMGGRALGQVLRAALPSAEEIQKDPEAAAKWAGKALGEVLPRLVGAPGGLAVGSDAGQAAAEWVRALSPVLPWDLGRSFLTALFPFLPAPDRTIILRRFLAAFYEVGKGWAQGEEERALWSNNLSVALSAVGRGEEALEATKEAVEIRRRLAERNPDAFLPDLATSLNNLGSDLSDVGRIEEALEATKEAAEIYRRLAEKNPDAFLPDLARSLGVLGWIFSAMERPEEAVRAFEEGLRILLPFYRRLPGAFGNLTESLHEGYLEACRDLGKTPDPELLKGLDRDEAS